MHPLSDQTRAMATMGDLSEVTRFVVLSEARSGTSLLTDTLNSHPEIICHGEIFHPDPATHLRGSLAELSINDMMALRENETGIVEAAFNQVGVRAAGFKMWRSQNERACLQLLQSETCRKIIYERENKLAQFSSRILAQALNVWKRPKGETSSLDKVPLLDFSEAEFRVFLSYQTTLFDFYRTSVRGPSLELTYREIAAGGFAKVTDFLGVTEVSLSNMTEQIHSGSILLRFKPEAHEAIVDFLDRIGKPSWIME